MRALAVLDKVFLSCNFSVLAVVTDNPAYRSNLTSFTLEHVAIQTLTLFHFYRELTLRLGEELELIGGPHMGRRQNLQAIPVRHGKGKGHRSPMSSYGV